MQSLKRRNFEAQPILREETWAEAIDSIRHFRCKTNAENNNNKSRAASRKKLTFL